MTHSTRGSLVGKSDRIDGIATTNTGLSRTTMSAAMTTPASVAQRRGSGADMGSLTPAGSRGLTAVDDELGTRRIGVLVRDQPQREFRHLVRLRVATQRDADRRRQVVEVVVTHHRRV